MPRRAAYRVASDLGLRRREIKLLRWGDFNIPGGGQGMVATVCVPASISKNRKSKVFELGPELVAELLTLRPVDCAPFQPVFEFIVRVKTMRRDLARAGIVFVDELGRWADFHSLRKTFGTALVLNGEHPRVVMDAMRHSDMKLTMKLYTDAKQLPVAAAMKRLPWYQLKERLGKEKTA